MGTRFIASHEARAAEVYKKRITEIREVDTVVTRSYSGKPMRVIRNRYVDEMESHPERIRPSRAVRDVAWQRKHRTEAPSAGRPRRSRLAPGAGVGSTHPLLRERSSTR
jgi:NAD(P)H-dependent flavin oxidoreductase YrpB (nitropropane dioxygenase family)